MNGKVKFIIITILMLAITAAAMACGGATSSGGNSSNEASVDERNAAASAAVTYESGAGFVEALEGAGVPCTNPSISPVNTSGVHVADSFSCIYAKDDLVNMFVAWPSELSSTYFSMYFENYQKAQAGFGSEQLILKGNLWFAVASTDQRLFDIQDALGGQLAEPIIVPTATDTQTIAPTVESKPIDITGIYTLRGTNFDGSAYAGEVTITKSDNTYNIIWSIGKQQSQTGTGTFDGTQLIARWQEGKNSGDAIYALQPDGSLIGIWTQDGHDGQGTETLIPKR